MSKPGTKWRGEIPRAANGNIATWDGYGSFTMEPNFEFDGVLEYGGFSRGRSASNVILRGEKKDGQPERPTYYVFMTDFEKIVRFMVHGVVKGRFTFCKRGANYGLILLEAHE